MPEHWEVLPFTKCTVEHADYRGATPEKVESGVFLVTAKNVRRGWIDYEGSKEYVREDQYQQIMRRGLPHQDDILLTTEAPLGNVALVDREDVAFAQRVIRFRLDERKLLPRFALLSMLSPYFEYRARLIADVVTGKLDVRGAKLPPLNEEETLDEVDRDDDGEQEEDEQEDDGAPE